MIFKDEKDQKVEINAATFKEILRGGIAGYSPGLSQVVFKDGTIRWVKASAEEILKAVTGPSR